MPRLSRGRIAGRRWEPGRPWYESRRKFNADCAAAESDSSTGCSSTPLSVAMVSRMPVKTESRGSGGEARHVCAIGERGNRYSVDEAAGAAEHVDICASGP